MSRLLAVGASSTGKTRLFEQVLYAFLSKFVIPSYFFFCLILFSSYIIKNQKETIGGDLQQKQKGAGSGGGGVIDRLVICFAVHDPVYNEWFDKAPVCIYHKGLPDKKELEDGSLIKKDCNNLIILDDLGLTQKLHDTKKFF